jgi:hypothetical protein
VGNLKRQFRTLCSDYREGCGDVERGVDLGSVGVRKWTEEGGGCKHVMEIEERCRMRGNKNIIDTTLGIKFQHDC